MAENAPLRVGSAFPDPPFEVDGAAVSGLDVDLMTAIAAELGRPLVVHRYEGPNFEGIFAELGRSIDVVASGATITEHRKTMARWCDPYLRSGQSLVVNVATAAATPDTDHLHGMTLGVQEGNTSQPVAQALQAAWRGIGSVRAPPSLHRETGAEMEVRRGYRCGRRRSRRALPRTGLRRRAGAYGE